MPLKAENGFLPDLKAIPEEIAKRAKLMWIGYPNNPTGALATSQFFADVVAFAERNNVIVAHDNAYSEIYFDEPPPSFLATPGRARPRHRVPLALEDLQHDRLARRLRRRQPRAHRGASAR
jgi:aspartate/methionine/tyrosine aminotransferase